MKKARYGGIHGPLVTPICSIAKVFSSNGEPVQADDNPYPVSEADFIAKAGDSSWINEDFLRALGA